MGKVVSAFNICLAMTLTLTPGISDNVRAKEDHNILEVVEISLGDSRSSRSLKALNNNDSEDTYYFIHNEGEEINPADIKDYIKAELKINHSSEDEDEGVAPKLMGVGVYEQYGARHVDYIFDQIDEVPLDEIREEIQKKVEIAENESFSNKKSLRASANPEDTYSDSYTFRVRDTNQNTLAGVYTSNVDYTRRGTSTLSGKKVSVWDVKFFNQTEPMNDYQTRELAMRYRHLGDAIDEQTIRSYGPYTTTDDDTSVTVGLSGLVPSVSWTFNRKAATITDESSLSSHYTKWVVDFALGTKTAKSNYVYEPGVRVTNDDAAIVFRHNHYINYYRNLNSQAKLSSKTIELILTDL